MFAIDKKERLIAVAVGSALLAGVLGWVYLRHLENTFQEGSETVPVLVANRYITPGTPLTPVLFSLMAIPKVYAQPTALSEFAVLVSSGRARFRNNVPLMEGTQLVQTGISPLYAEDGLSQIIPDNHVAVSFGIDAVRGLSGNIRPGDLINILHTPKPSQIPNPKETTEILFQAVPVLAVGKKMAIPGHGPRSTDKAAKEPAEEGPEEITVISVSLNPLAAVRLAHAREREVLSVALRPQGDDRVIGETAP